MFIKRMFFWVLFVNLIGISAYGSQRSVNLILNGSFEKTHSGAPVFWIFQNGPGAGGAVISLDTTISHTGHNSVKIVVPTSEGCGSIVAEPMVNNGYNLIPIEPGTAYALSFWVKGRDVDTMGYGINIRMGFSPQDTLSLPYGSGQHEINWAVYQSNLTGTFNWTKQTYRFVTKPWQKYVSIYFQLRSNIGTIWYDDISLRKIGKTKVPAF